MSVYTGNSEEVSEVLITCNNCYNSDKSLFEYYLNDYALYVQFNCPSCNSRFNWKLVHDDSEHFSFEDDLDNNMLLPIISQVYKEVF